MKYCKTCNVKITDNLTNCPLCGKKIMDTVLDDTFICAPYPSTSIQNKSEVVRNIFIGILVLGFLVICAIFGVLVPKYEIIGFYVIGAIFLWLSVLSHIFKGHRTAEVLNLNAFYFIFLTGIILAILGELKMYIEYFVPITACLMILIQAMIVFISKAWNKYCITINIYSLTILVCLAINVFAKNNIIASFITSLFALVSITCSFTLGGKILKSELKRKFYL